MLTEAQAMKFVFDYIRFCPSKRKLKKSGYYRQGNYREYYNTLDKTSFRQFYYLSIVFSALSAFAWPHFESIGRICMKILLALILLLSLAGFINTFGKYNAKKYFFSTILSSFSMIVAMILAEWALTVKLQPSPLLTLPFVMIPVIVVLLFRDFFLKKAGVEFSRKQRNIRIITYSAALIVVMGMLIYCLTTVKIKDSKMISCTLLTMVLSSAPGILLSDIFKLYHLIRLERSGTNINELDPIVNNYYALQ